MLYQVATAALSPGDLAWPLRALFRSQQNIQIILGEVRTIDRAACHVELVDGAPIPYDWLVLARVARHSYFSHPEWEADTPGLKTLPDALELRERMLMAFEKAERLNERQDVRQYLTFRHRRRWADRRGVSRCTGGNRKEGDDA